MNYNPTFLSLGPGSPDMLTLGTLCVLKEADRIYCFESGGVSRAAEIIRLTATDMNKVVTIDIPMTTDRSRINEIYDNLAETIMQDVAEGMNIAVATEGDSSIFATTHYVMDRLVASGIQCEQMAGVPSFIAAANLAGLHLIKQQERLMVIPGRISADEIVTLVDSGCNLVIMKLSLAHEAIAEIIQQRHDFAFHYFENVGTDKQLYMELTPENIKDKFPYFSLMIIQKKDNTFTDER